LGDDTDDGKIEMKKEEIIINEIEASKTL